MAIDCWECSHLVPHFIYTAHTTPLQLLSTWGQESFQSINGKTK